MDKKEKEKVASGILFKAPDNKKHDYVFSFELNDYKYRSFLFPKTREDGSIIPCPNGRKYWTGSILKSNKKIEKEEEDNSPKVEYKGDIDLL